MTKFLWISLITMFVLLCIASGFAYHRGTVIESQNNQIQNLTANVNILIEGRKRDYKNKVELAERVEELEQEAKKDTSCFGWNTDISNSAIVQRLRQD